MQNNKIYKLSLSVLLFSVICWSQSVSALDFGGGVGDSLDAYAKSVTEELAKLNYFAHLNTSPITFVPEESPLIITYDLNTFDKIMNLKFVISNPEKTKYYFSNSQNINFNGSNFLIYKGKDSFGAYIPDGDYLITASIGDSTTAYTTLTTNFSVKHKVTVSTTTGTSSGSSSSSGSTSGTTSGSTSTTTTTSTSTSTSTDSGTTSADGKTEAKPLPASPDILTCKKRAAILYFEKDLPAYDRMGVDCSLTMPATIEAAIYNKSFDPKGADNSANLVKTIQGQIMKKAGLFYLSWTGLDEYDEVSALDEYNFVISAKPDALHTPDLSVQKFTIENAPGTEVGAEAENVDTTSTTGTTTTTTSGSTETSTATNGTSSTDNLHGTSDSNAENITDSASTEEIKVETKEASKCPGVFYPNDIDASSVKDLIRQAYDECLTRGYEDGTFRPKQDLTRAEATKIIILASSNVAKQGCYDSDCGTPFIDLDAWQGPWVRAAWDLKIVSGVGMGQFAPNRSITRAESAALAAKTFKIAPRQGCYDADCGAGQPNDLFTDITQMWEGPYLRALSDKGIIKTLLPGKFFPETAITREQFLEMALKARSAK